MWIGIEEGIDGQFLISEDQSVAMVSIMLQGITCLDVAVNDLLNLISVHCPIPNNYTESLFRLHFPGKI